MSLSKILKEISDNWIDYRNHCKDISKTGSEIRKVKQDHKIFDLVKNYCEANPGSNQETIFSVIEKLKGIIHNHVGIIELAEVYKEELEEKDELG